MTELQKISVDICCGTTCYMLGAAELLTLEDKMPSAWKPLLDIRAIPCMEICTREDLGHAPFVRIDGVQYSNATLESVYQTIARLLEQKGFHHE